MKLSKPVVGILLIVLCISAVAVVKIVKMRQAGPKAAVLDARAKGVPSAPVKIVEFTDFQCPACARGMESVTAAITKYPGQIYLEVKHFPLPMHAFARRAAIHAECAASQGKFWDFHDVLFKSQSSWSKMPAVDEYFIQLAVALQIDGAKLEACVIDPKIEQAIAQDIAEGKGLGVSSTPTFFVNGKMIVGGGKNFTDEIDRILGVHEK